jgi:NAD+ synthase (glutamine-hydrolysing)
VEDLGYNDVLVGLSGGIDSSAVATLAVDTFGAAHVCGLLMPSDVSSAASVDDATALAANLGIRYQVAPIGEAVGELSPLLRQTALSLGARPEAIYADGLAAQNLQARLRMCYLMYLSNALDLLVLNTGNKSEAAMGYSTLYGDTCGAFAPFGDVYKTDLYALCRWRNESTLQPQAPIPQPVFTKAPSAELYVGQTDQDSLPPYDRLDQVLKAYVEEGSIPGATTELIAGSTQGLLDVQSVITAVERNAFKRAAEPAAAVASAHPFSDFDRRFR